MEAANHHSVINKEMESEEKAVIAIVLCRSKMSYQWVKTEQKNVIQGEVRMEEGVLFCKL